MLHIPIGDRWHGNGYCLITKGELTVANLVTKERCFHKPTYKALEESLINLKAHLRGTSELRRTLVMPRIGCGLDKLEWEKVRDMIQRVFSDMCINIYVYTL